MKIFFDTNIIISAYYFKGNERKALLKTINSNHTPVISTQVVSEIQEVMENKFDEKEDDIEDFLERLLADVNLGRDHRMEVDIEDEPDRYIIGSAVKADCDFLVTGDKGIQDCEIEEIRIIDAKELLKNLD